MYLCNKFLSMHTISNFTRSLNCLARGWMSRERGKLEEVLDPYIFQVYIHYILKQNGNHFSYYTYM
jgi:hypothetical protein